MRHELLQGVSSFGPVFIDYFDSLVIIKFFKFKVVVLHVHIWQGRNEVLKLCLGKNRFVIMDPPFVSLVDLVKRGL